MKPAVFVGSSVEGLKIAYAVQTELQHDAEVTVWSQGIFRLSVATLDNLLDALNKSDFGIFVFSPDDAVQTRDSSFLATRDNVILELGVFIGRLDKRRNFIVMPEGMTDFHLPTDLLGITPASYDAHRSDGNLQAALGPACYSIRKMIADLGSLKRNSPIPANVGDWPDDKYYHFRVQNMLAGVGNPPINPEFKFNQRVGALNNIAAYLANGQKFQLDGVSLSGYDIHRGFVKFSVLCSKSPASKSELKGADATKIDQYWNELRAREDFDDITSELTITDRFAN